MLEFAACTTMYSCFKILCAREGVRLPTISLISLIISRFSLQFFTFSLYAPKKSGVGGWGGGISMIIQFFICLLKNPARKKWAPPYPSQMLRAWHVLNIYIYFLSIICVAGRQLHSKTWCLNIESFFFNLAIVLGILMKWYKCYNNCWRICFKRKSIRGVE